MICQGRRQIKGYIIIQESPVMILRLCEHLLYKSSLEEILKDKMIKFGKKCTHLQVVHFIG